MTFKLCIFSFLLCCIHVLCLTTNSPETTTQDTIGFLNEVIRFKSSDLISIIKTLRQDNKQFIIEANNDLENARNNLFVKIDNLTVTVDLLNEEAEENGQDISSCVSSCHLAMSGVYDKINGLDLTVIDANLTLKKIPKNIGVLKKLIGRYKKSIKVCQFQVSLVDQATYDEEIQSCVFDRIHSIDDEMVISVKDILSDTAVMKALVSESIESINTEVTELIEKSAAEFAICVSTSTTSITNEE